MGRYVTSFCPIYILILSTYRGSFLFFLDFCFLNYLLHGVGEVGVQSKEIEPGARRQVVIQPCL